MHSTSGEAVKELYIFWSRDSSSVKIMPLYNNNGTKVPASIRFFHNLRRGGTRADSERL